jgi:hypothetical protein
MPLDVPGSVESVSTVFTYFNPTRSPYYVTGVAACVALYLACDVQRLDSWRMLYIPSFLVAALTLLLAIRSKNDLTPEEHEDQLRFARSTCISVAVVALAWAGTTIEDPLKQHFSNPAKLFDFTILDHTNFTINVGICCVQIALFMFLSWALNRRALPKVLRDRNYVQITLLTSAFLADTCLNLAKATTPGDPGRPHHQLVALALGSLWVICVIFWMVKLRSLIVHPDKAKQAKPA